jgi:hypothetical protein
VPNANGSAEKEAVTNRGHDQNELGLNRSISHVSQPSLTVMLPHESCATGVAVMVFPGGAFSRIVIDKERIGCRTLVRHAGHRGRCGKV